MIDCDNWERWPQPDGATWHVQDLPGGHLVLTSRGQELIHDQPELEDYFHAYLYKALGGPALSGAVETRKFIASGARSSVYEMAPGIAVKEADKTGSSLYAVRRMDRLFTLIESSVPRWIDMPHHYAVLHSTRFMKDFIFQQKIDSGITAEWLLDQEALADYQREAMQREFGEVGESEQAVIAASCANARQLIAEALEASGEKADSYLTDYHPGNILVERLRTPIANQNHKLWIIDQ